MGAPSVLSPPLPQNSRRTWTDAGYEDFINLALMRMELGKIIPAPNHLVVEVEQADLDGLLSIDAAAFDPFWRLDRQGMLEALNATSRSTVHIIRDTEGKAAGFAVVGYGHAISYLQRMAVHPRWQGQGMGRSLVRAAARKARSSGARAMLLNTQHDNQAAGSLYESEGFHALPEPLSLFRRLS